MNLDEVIKTFDPDNDYTIKEITEMVEVTNAMLLSAIRRGALPARLVFNRYYIKGRNIRNMLLGEKPVD